MKNIIKTIDLWTERKLNDYTCINGAFVDGFDNNGKPFDTYKIIKNCNCIITISNPEINVTNKHNAIVYYLNKKPVRLIALNGLTDIDKCVSHALSQNFNGDKLINIYKKYNIKHSIVDLKEKPIANKCLLEKEVDVGSCDRWGLLHNMLSGSYTEDSTPYGHYEDNQYEFIANINIVYNLITDTEVFLITHDCAFINMLKSRIVPVQNNSHLTCGKLQTKIN